MSEKFDYGSLAYAQRQEVFHREKLAMELKGLLQDVEVALRKLERGDRRYIETAPSLGMDCDEREWMELKAFLEGLDP